MSDDDYYDDTYFDCERINGTVKIQGKDLALLEDIEGVRGVATVYGVDRKGTKYFFKIAYTKQLIDGWDLKYFYDWDNPIEGFRYPERFGEPMVEITKRTRILNLEYDEAYLDRNSGEVGMAQFWEVEYDKWVSQYEPGDGDFGKDFVLVKRINNEWVEV